MSDPKIPQVQDDKQNPQPVEGEELQQDELDDVAGGSNNNCNGWCALDPIG